MHKENVNLREIATENPVVVYFGLAISYSDREPVHSARAECAVPMMRGVIGRLRRASLIAYGGWVLFVCVVAAATSASLNQVERTEVRAALARTDRGAAALEQTMLRTFEGLYALRDLAQTRQRLIGMDDLHGRAAVEQQMQDLADSRRFGIDEVLIASRDGALAWSSADPVHAARPHRLHPFGTHRPAPRPRIVALDPVGPAGIAVTRPVLTPQGRWIIHVTVPLQGDQSVLVVALDATAMSAMIAGEPGEVAAVELLSDGAFLARSNHPQAAFGEQVVSEAARASLGLAEADPVISASGKASAGELRDRTASVDRLIGFRVPKNLPIVVSQMVNTRAALADFLSLRRTVLLAAAAVCAGGLLATRLILSNFLLRRRLSEQALQDPLTGLPNRRYFTDVMPRRLDAAVRDGGTAAVLLIDLDGFKYVNDTRGHATGDTMLREVAKRLRACAGEQDHIMRLGGDEFALVRVGRQQHRDATALARFIVSELSRIYEIDGYQVRAGASIGIAFPPEGGNSLPDLLRSADIALYSVKADGGGGHQMFDPGMEESVRSRRALEMDLREALLRQELEVYYQPLVQLDPRRVSGFEALVRWHHPVHGMVMPGRFIPMAEETGLIAGIGQWVLRQACMEAARWPAHTRIAVNISPVQFDRSDIVDVVASALRESRLDPGRLELEITEGVVILDTGDALATMRRLQALGVRLALDDFGTGYSSLSYLRAFPFDKVKIDGSFLADLNGDGGAIIRAVLALCAHLELDTLVEGVETEDQLFWLRHEGCTEVQGHLFSEPQPAEALPQIIEDVASAVASKPKIVSLFRKV
jgi:diguanylate cyclase (GGDEF)-like protein